MNKNYVCKLGLICTIALFTVQPLFAQISVYDEIEQSAPVEEVQTIETQPVQTEEPSVSSEEKEQVEEQNIKPEIVTEETEKTTEETAPAEPKPVQTVQQKTTTVTLKKIEQKSFLSKVLEKINSLNLSNKLTLAKNSVLKYLSEQQFINKFYKQEQVAEHKEYLEFAPYYFIYPSFNSYGMFADNITNIIELMPYTLGISNMAHKLNAPKNLVTPQGITDTLVLMNAPSPKIEVVGKSMYAKLVIDIKNNTLYKYDKNGFPLKAYLVATGARGTRTMPGLRVVTYMERFPYQSLPDSKRALDPYSYGPYIIFLNVVDPKTGRQYVVEQLLHGNGNEYSIGKKVSHGCVRTNNNVMRKELSKEVKRGDYILLINPDIG